MPKVSVIIPSFNHEKFIAEAINSVLNQTFQDFEIIITDVNNNLFDNPADIESNNLSIKTMISGKIITPHIPKFEYASEKRPLFADSI